MEFMQFHPTVLYIAGSSRSLITEAMRGEGARLVDSTGQRFMPDYDARAELAPRDVVSQAIVAQMEKTRHPSVFLDLSHLEPERVRKRFPGIARTCAEFGIDIATDPIPVRPGAHYMIGGVTVDHDGRTTLPGLWAAGEVTSSGLHGANRLASNSLLEGLVYGAHAGAGASAAALEEPDSFHAIPLENRRVEPHERAARPGRHPQLAQEPDVACGRRAARRAAAGRGRPKRSPLVRLRAGAAVHRPGRLGTAKHAHRGPPDDRRGACARGIARRPPADRLSRRRTTRTGGGTSGAVAAQMSRAFSAGKSPAPVREPASWLDRRKPGIDIAQPNRVTLLPAGDGAGGLSPTALSGILPLPVGRWPAPPASPRWPTRPVRHSPTEALR